MDPAPAPSRNVLKVTRNQFSSNSNGNSGVVVQRCFTDCPPWSWWSHCWICESLKRAQLSQQRCLHPPTPDDSQKARRPADASFSSSADLWRRLPQIECLHSTAELTVRWQVVQIAEELALVNRASSCGRNDFHPRNGRTSMNCFGNGEMQRILEHAFHGMEKCFRQRNSA